MKQEVSLELFGGVREPVELGRFHLRRRIGRGAMGSVYEAYDNQRGCIVALKLLDLSLPHATSRAKREFRALSGVVHPNLVTLHELFNEQGVWFFTMEFVQGVTLDRWVRPSEDSFDEPRLRMAFDQIVSAVTTLHAAGKLHRDLKPTNVLVTPEGRVVVLDFGLVAELRDIDETASPQTLAGTPAYLAPEVVGGASASVASDWYAVGVMLYEALTGVLPFDGPPSLILAAKQEHEAPDPGLLLDGLPTDLRKRCVGLLQRTPTMRLDACRSWLTIDELTPRNVRSKRTLERIRLYGRDAELATFSKALDRVVAGDRAALLLSGRSGMGKSALLTCCAEMSAQQVLTLRGRCHAHESVPYKVFDGVIEGLAAHLRGLTEADLEGLVPRHAQALCQLFPTLNSVPAFARSQVGSPRPPEARQQRVHAFAAFEELLLRLSDRTPVVLAIDDLQWGDVDSAHLMVHVLRSVESPRLLLAGAYRSDEVADSEFLRVLLAPVNVAAYPLELIEVGPLPRESAIALALDLMNESMEGSHSLACSIAAEANGVAFFVSELAREARQSGLPIAVSLEQLLLERAASMPIFAHTLLEVLSVAAGPLEFRVALDAAGLPRGDFAAAIALSGAHLARWRSGVSDELFETYHDRIRESVVAAMSPTRRRAVHAGIARALEHANVSDRERLVAHHLAAGNLDRALRLALEAAEIAMGALAFNRAAALFQTAIELVPEHDLRRTELIARRGAALANAGRGAEAADAFLSAAAHSSGEECRQLRVKAARYYLRSGRLSQGIQLAGDVLKEVGVALPVSESAAIRALMWQRMRLRGRWFARRAPSSFSAQRTARLETLGDLVPELITFSAVSGAVVHARYAREALEVGDAKHSLQCLVWEVFNTALIGGRRNRQKADAFAIRIGELANVVATPYAKALSHLADSFRWIFSGSGFRDGQQAAAEARKLFSEQCTGAFWEAGVAMHMELGCFELVGDMGRHAAQLSGMQREFGERGDQVMLSFVHNLPLAALARDQPRDALDLLESYRQWLQPVYTNFRFTWWLRMSDAMTYLGLADEALDLLEVEWRSFRRSHYYRCALTRERAEFTRARTLVAAYVSKHDTRLRESAWKAATQGSFGHTTYAGLQLNLAGALHLAEGRTPEALGLLGRGRAMLHSTQASLCTLLADRVLCELRDDPDGSARADLELASHGIANPQRWARNYIPIRD